MALTATAGPAVSLISAKALGELRHSRSEGRNRARNREPTRDRAYTLLEWKDEGKHFLDVGILADWEIHGRRRYSSRISAPAGTGTPETLPSPLFGATANYLVAKETGKFYFGTVR